MCSSAGFSRLSACLACFLWAVIPAEAAQNDVAPLCARAAASHDGWQDIDAGPFLVKLPVGYRKVDVIGIDSLVGRWEMSATRFVTFDWGPYSNDLSQAGRSLSELVSCTETIGGHQATVIVGFDVAGQWEGPGQKLVVAAAWRTIGALTMTATGEKSDLPDLLAIVRSVTFKPR
jgi:hypothetical protein